MVHVTRHQPVGGRHQHAYQQQGAEGHQEVHGGEGDDGHGAHPGQEKERRAGEQHLFDKYGDAYLPEFLKSGIADNRPVSVGEKE